MHPGAQLNPLARVPPFGAMAAKRSERSQPRRWTNIAPLLMPVAKTRSRSMQRVALELVEQSDDEPDIVVTRAPVALARFAALGRRRVVEGPLGADRSLGPRRGVAREVVPRGDQLAARLEAGSLGIHHHVTVLVRMLAERVVFGLELVRGGRIAVDGQHQRCRARRVVSGREVETILAFELPNLESSAQWNRPVRPVPCSRSPYSGEAIRYP